MLAHEGGYVNHPKDPGGATNQGVTQKVYDAYRKYHGQHTQSVRNISPTEVSEIYAKNYWRLVRADSLPRGFDYAVFDFAVNSGVSRAIRYMQRLVGVDDDGIIGVMTLGAVEDYARRDEEGLIAQYCANRLAFVRSLKTFPTFGKGWIRRIIGYTPGVQENDKGVIDYATMMARRDAAYTMPLAIGSKPGEPESAKAEAPLENETFVTAPTVSTVEEAKLTLAELIANNDDLASKIGGA